MGIRRTLNYKGRGFIILYFLNKALYTLPISCADNAMIYMAVDKRGFKINSFVMTDFIL